MTDRPLSILVITNGAAGADAPALGLATALGAPAPALKHVRLPAPYRWLAPWGPTPRGLAAGLGPPWPDLAIGVTRQAIAYLRALRSASGGRTFTVFLQDPRAPLGWFDLVWAPLHDELRGANVIATATPPHRLTPERLAAAAAALEPGLRDLPRPRIAVLVGGPNKAFSFGAEQAQELTRRLDVLAPGGAFLITTSRRTPPDVAALVSFWARTRPGALWTGEGANPLMGFLGAADALVVTADSINMTSEAAATGKPVYVFDLPGDGGKFAIFHKALRAAGATRPLDGAFTPWTYPPVDANPVIAAAVRDRLDARRSD
jgi:mitochondrial fission protein ELM1